MKERAMDYQHFSHHHLLISLKLDEGEEINCNACERLIFEPFHGCMSCTYYLHDQCLNTPRWLEHPSHASHALTLLPNPTYSTAAYTCNACGSTGNSFSVSCAKCEFDLHVHCANMPNTILLNAHPHELKLTFDIPVKFKCDDCAGAPNESSWVYHCADCNFGIHFNCAISHVQPEFNLVAADGVTAPDQSGSGLPSATINDTLNSHRESANEMLRAQVELMKIQNRVRLNGMAADISRFNWYRY